METKAVITISSEDNKIFNLVVEYTPEPTDVDLKDPFANKLDTPITHMMANVALKAINDIMAEYSSQTIDILPDKEGWN